jgi:hypothetical protein
MIGNFAGRRTLLFDGRGDRRRNPVQFLDDADNTLNGADGLAADRPHRGDPDRDFLGRPLGLAGQILDLVGDRMK